MSLQNLHLEKLLKEYDFLTSDLKYKKAVIDQYLPALRNENENVEPVVEKQFDVEKVKYVPSEIEKQIYRQISKLTHPDKSDAYENDFKNASVAYSTGNFLQLMKIAKDLQIQFNLDDETVEKIEKEIHDMRMESGMLDQHLIWKWYLAKDSEEKETLEHHIRSL